MPQTAEFLRALRRKHGLGEFRAKGAGARRPRGHNAKRLRRTLGMAGGPTLNLSTPKV